MAFDPITDIVSHFIGLFHVASEEARLRDFYDRFDRRPPSEAESKPAPLAVNPFQSPYDLGRFDPGISYPVRQAPAAEEDSAPSAGFAQSDQPLSGLPPPDRGPDDILPVGPEGGGLSFDGGLYLVDGTIQLPLPGSVMTLTVQTLTLEDDDLVTFGPSAGFVAPAVYLAQLTALAEVGAALHAEGRLETIAALAGSSEQIIAAAKALTTLADPQQDVASASSHRVDGAGAIIVNGVATSEMPQFEDSLPAFLKPQLDPEPGPDAPPADPHATAGDNPYAVDAGHTVVTGANMSLNEAFVTTRWVDAPVISVAGDVISVDSISQVSVLQDVGQGGGIAGTSASQVINAAQIAMSPSAALVPPASPGEDIGLPTDWVIVRIDTDLVSVNWIDQHIFATDTDRVEVSFSGSNTFLGTGENLLSNATSISEYGMQYDLIIVGGNMITVNAITQTLVLLDSDTVKGGGNSPVEGVSSNDNLLFNQALIQKTGIDTVGAISQAFQAVTQDLAAGATTLSADIAQSALFAGKGMVTALFVKGDFIKMNLIAQTNIVGDADQVTLALDALQASISGQVNMTLGSNALLNAASIQDHGVDSLVMAGGDVYSDALIYQADLIDTGASEIAGSTTALASEAVAFLADGMLSPAFADDDEGLSPVFDSGSSLDVLHSVLS